MHEDINLTYLEINLYFTMAKEQKQNFHMNNDDDILFNMYKNRAYLKLTERFVNSQYFFDINDFSLF